jgi:hypothetical protein
MMWLLGALAAYVMLSSKGRSGLGPFDDFPGGTERVPFASAPMVGALSGRLYTASMFRSTQIGTPMTYTVCVDNTSKEWIGWLWQESTNARLFWRGSAESDASLEEMKKDFGT